jgi:hypothetical protein
MRAIERSRDLDVLTLLLARRPAGAALASVRRTPTGEHHLVLVPAATVALCALDAGLGVAKGSDLRVLLINAGQLDFLDAGQWYRFVAPMLDLKGRIEVTANVPDRSVLRHSVVREAVTAGMRIAVRQHEGSLESLLAGAQPGRFDLAVCFHGQTLWRNWRSDGVRQLIAAGVPVYVCEYGPLLAQLGMATGGLLGVQGELAIERNRFALLSKVRGENWARTVWRCCEAVDGWTEIDADGRTLATTAAQMVLDSHQRGLAEQPFAVGARVMGLRQADGSDPSWETLHAMDGLVVRAGSRRMLQWDSAAEALRDVGAIDDDWLPLLGEFDTDWDPGSRLLWAAMIKNCWTSRARARAAA